MRRLLSFVLLLVFGLPTVATALDFSASPDSRLPACCRRNGAHHCEMSQQEIDALLNGTQFTTVHGKCPYYPKVVTVLQHQQLSFHTETVQLMALLSRPASIGQIQASAHTAEEGARHKRGPPPTLL